jgi:hypothetical protein
LSWQQATTPYLKGYGLGCWIDTLYGHKIVSHGGNTLGFTGYFGRIQEDDTSVILLNNIYNHQIETIGLSIFSILYNQPYSYFDEKVLTHRVLKKYVGEYIVNANYRVKITCRANQLFIQRNEQLPLGLFAYKNDTFFQKDNDIQVSFQLKNGSANKIIISRG